MAQTKIHRLTPEQRALIPIYRDKWKSIALSTERIDREEAADAVKAAYVVICKQKPEIIFCDSPYSGLLVVIDKQLKQRLNTEFYNQILHPFYDELRQQLTYQLDGYVSSKIAVLDYLYLSNAQHKLESRLRSQLKSQLQQSSNLRNPWFQAQALASASSWLDFCISVLKCSCDLRRWEAFESLVKYCGWILPYEYTAIVCDRPTKLSFDSEGQLHAEGEPATQFADGYSLYAYHGILSDC